MNDYIKKIRAKLGKNSFIHPAARIIIENDREEFLVIERKDNGKIGLPAGALEEGESISDCIQRETIEETGLHLLEWKVMGISSSPDREKVIYPNGDQIQYFTVEFYSKLWKGQLNPQDRDEVSQAYFVPWHRKEELPMNEQSAFESLDYFRKNGRLMLK